MQLSDDELSATWLSVGAGAGAIIGSLMTALLLQ